MHFAPEYPALAAFFRTIEARLSVPEVGIYEWRSNACGPWKVAGALRERLGSRSDQSPGGLWHRMSGPIAQALRSDEPARLDAGELGFTSGFVAVCAVPLPGDSQYFLMIHDPRHRRLTPTVSSALQDGSAMLAVLIPEILGRRGIRQTPSILLRRDGSFPKVAALREVEAALRDLPDATTLYMIDLDRFRSINEALGVTAGDAILAATSARLIEGLGENDRFVRLEGDRFLILAADRSREPRAMARAFQEIVEQPHVMGGRAVALQCSIGIAPAGGTNGNARQLLVQADSAMRRAKTEGRNRSVLHEKRFDVASHDKSQLELDLSNATGTGQMNIAFQPFVDLSSGEVSGFEALLRWRHPTRGEVPPNVFIPLAESTGRILALGMWTLETACRRAARWPRPMTLAVNISALQFHQAGFTSQVDAVLARTGFPAHRLELEITETVLMRDNPDTIIQLETLIRKGIRIALDDFGTGYSALAYLARLPHHRIKLDKSFVQDLTNPGTAELIRAIISQARSSGISITAEGVEGPELLHQVRTMGFTHAQGYATGHPTEDPSPIFQRQQGLRPGLHNTCPTIAATV